jgi:hypothetical protein
MLPGRPTGRLCRLRFSEFNRAITIFSARLEDEDFLEAVAA